MTIKDLIKQENKSTLKSTLNGHLEEMIALKKEIKENPTLQDLYDMHENMLRGMIETLHCINKITTTEYLEIMSDIRLNY